MVRINLKGGVWRNAEDELLKVAVMKYGKQNWSRVASLLNRKSAKQCKARWNEWLDPDIKKTEWTRAEEEMLLMLAKSLPNQWQTIAPMVGRTATQCIEHFTHLTDLALGKDDVVDPADDPRRMRPGEIDPFPEAKPARPDAVDMDEGDKEMLQEARARLANTKGKKAKRKARERHLEEARRMAQLQKLRELRAAGIELKPKKLKKGEVDDAKVVRFQHFAPAGPFDTTVEAERTHALKAENTFIGTKLSEIATSERARRQEAEKAKDVMREKVRKQTDLPQLVQKINQLNDAPIVRNIGPLALPAPQITDDDVESLARLGTLEALSKASASARTPMGPPASRVGGAGGLSSREAILAEVRNVVTESKAQTPLAGGDNVTLAPSEYSNLTGFQTSKARQEMRTPSAMALAAAAARGPTGQPALGAGSKRSATLAGLNLPGPSQGGAVAAGAGETPRHHAAAGAQTPMRDELGISGGSGRGKAGFDRPIVDGDDSSVDGSGAGMSTTRMQQGMAPGRNEVMNARKRLRAALTSLPQAENEYSLVWPSLPDDVAAVASAGASALTMAPIDWLEDAEARDLRAAADDRAAAQAAEARKPEALRRGLPRPSQVNLSTGKDTPAAMAGTGAWAAAEADQPGLAAARALVQAEALAMLRRDAAAHPVDSKAVVDPRRVAATALPQPSDGALSRARAMIEAEAKKGAQLQKTAAHAAAATSSSVMVDVEPQFATLGAQLRAEAASATAAAAVGAVKVTRSALSEAWASVAGNVMFLPLQKRFGWLAGEPTASRVAALRQQAQVLQGHLQTERTRNGKAEQQLKVLLGGYEARLGKARAATAAAASEVDKASRSLSCFTALKQAETAGRVPRRIAEARTRLGEQKALERQLQQQFVKLTDELDAVAAAAVSTT